MYSVAVDSTNPIRGLTGCFSVRPAGRTDALTSALRRIRRDTGLGALAHHVDHHQRNAAGGLTVCYCVTLGRDGVDRRRCRVNHASAFLILVTFATAAGWAFLNWGLV